MDDETYLAQTTDQLWAVRECLRERDFGQSFKTAYSALKDVDLVRLDQIVAAKAGNLFTPVTFSSARQYARRMDEDAILYEARIVTPMPEQRLRRVLKRSIDQLDKMSSKNNNLAAVARHQDLSRHWSAVFEYVDGTLANYSKRNMKGRLDNSVYRIDGLFVLLRNSSATVVEIVKYRNSVSIVSFS